MDEWKEGQPKKQGWYDCKIGEEETRLQWWICQLNPRKRYWKDENGQPVKDKVLWTGEPSARIW